MRRREVFVGPRLRVHLGAMGRARAGLSLLLMSIVLGAVTSAALATAIWFLVQALLQAVKNG